VFGGQQEHSFSGDLKSWMQFKDRSEATRQKADGTENTRAPAEATQ